jgi:hypothetical protein
MKDLIVLVADSQMGATFENLLARDKSFGISKPTFEIAVHPERDAGVFGKCHDFLRPFHRQYRFALVVFDREGCGSDKSTENIRHEVIQRIDASGWAGRNQVIIIEPELEIWVWVESPNVAKALGLTKDQLDKILSKYRRDINMKPENPKAAMEEALKISGLPHSSAIFAYLASSVSFKNCRDMSFQMLKTTLESWFGK